MKEQMILAVSGIKNSGKTTLLEKLIPVLCRHGFRCAVIKHDGHGFAPEREGTDTHRLLSAGAYGTAVFDGEKYQAVKYESVSEAELIRLFPEADFLFLEGFKHSAWPKIEIVRKENSRESVCDAETLIALVTDSEVSIPGVRTFAMEDAEAIAEYLIRCREDDHA